MTAAAPGVTAPDELMVSQRYLMKSQALPRTSRINSLYSGGPMPFFYTDDNFREVPGCDCCICVAHRHMGNAIFPLDSDIGSETPRRLVPVITNPFPPPPGMATTTSAGTDYNTVIVPVDSRMWPEIGAYTYGLRVAPSPTKDEPDQ